MAVVSISREVSIKQPQIYARCQEVNKENIRYILHFFFDNGENASQATEIVNGVYGADTVTVNYLQFWFRRFRLGILDASRTGRAIVENVYKITEIIEVDQHVSSLSIAQELNVDHKTVLNHLRKAGFKKKLDLRDLVAALWDKKLAFRTRERRKFWVFTDGPQRKEKKKRLRKPCCYLIQLPKRRASCSKTIELIYSVYGAKVSGGKAIFGSSAAIEFIFEAVPRVNSRLVKLTTLIVKGERFKIGQKDHCSHGRVQNH
ncbi:histone-lysine N-methyltransferase SETMAR [Trichonephila clavipes]|nr:histone-lysine N-methyltransferase SETMAR [Trichonephila clavipes]